MKIETKKINDLIPADYNPRKFTDKDYKKLKSSIEKFGYVEPIIWNKNTGHVVGGHQRLTILKELGLHEVNVVVVDLDITKEKLLNLNLNKVSSDWDFLKLKEIFDEFELDDLEITGFDNDEITGITSTFIPEEEEIEPDVVKDYTPSVPSDKFKVYLSFPTQEAAEKFLEDEGFNKKFNGHNTININIKNED